MNNELVQLQKDNAAQAEALRRTSEKCDKMQEEIKYLQEQNRILLRRGNYFGEEVVELRAWKAQAIACTPDWQAIGKALNLRLGTSVSDQVLPAILNLLREKRELLIQLRRLQSYCCHYVKNYTLTGRFKEVEETLSKYDQTVTSES
jgi:hypothetical protein